MYKPESLTFRRIEDGDTSQFIIKMDEHQAALESFSRQTGQMVDSIDKALQETLESVDSDLQETLNNAEQIRQRTEGHQKAAAASEMAAADSEAAAKKARDEAEGFSQGELPKGETGDTLIQGEDGLYRPGKIRSTVAVECSMSGSPLAASGHPYQISMSGRSRHVNGAVAGFRVTWWDGSTEDVAAINSMASIQKMVEREIGEELQVTVVAYDDVGNESREAFQQLEVVDIVIAPALVVSPKNGGNYRFDAAPWPLRVQTSEFTAYSPDTHEATEVQVRDTVTKASLVDYATQDKSQLANPVVSTTDFPKNTTSVDIRARHKGASLDWGPFGPWVTVSFADQVGELVLTDIGPQNFMVPPNVDTYSAVLVGGGDVGGGANAWANNLSVPSDRKLSGVVGGPKQSSTFADIVAGGASGLNGGTRSGGDGGGNGGSSTQAGTTNGYKGGSGAGGYSGNGGAGGNSASPGPQPGRGGGGGGGVGSPANGTAASSGGGVGLYGQGADGFAGTAASPGGRGGSGGKDGAVGGSSNANGPGGQYGGGGGVGGSGGSSTAIGAQGAIRLMWGGGRSFPNNAGAL